MSKTLALTVLLLIGIAKGQLSQAQLSPEQAEVWKGEENYFRFLNEKDLNSYMSLWDPRFTGWPDYEPLPVHKSAIEAGTREEFKIQPSEHYPAPTPVAVTVFGDVAITDYFWPENDKIFPYIYRITHTWQKGRQGWHIIGGMSCEVPRNSQGPGPKTESDSEPSSVSAPNTGLPALTPEQAEVWKVSQSWLSAYNHRDLDTFARLTADDFIGSTDDGIFMTKAGVLKRLATHPPDADQRQNARDIRVRLDGDTAVVNYRFSLVEHGFENQVLSFELRRTEVFQKKNSGWLAIAAHDSNLPINHREPVKTDPATFKDYAGEYEYFRPGFVNTYTVEGERLIDGWKGDKIEAFPMGNDTFFEREDLGWTTFLRDQQGRVTGYIYHYADGQVTTGRKIK